MQAGVAAVILDVVFSLGSNLDQKREPIILMVIPTAFVTFYFFHANVIYIILAGALAGIALELLQRRKGAA